MTVQHLSQFKKLQIKERKQGSTKSENPEDSFRDIFHRDNLYELTVEDIKKFVEYVDQPLYSSGRSVTNVSIPFCRQARNQNFSLLGVRKSGGVWTRFSYYPYMLHAYMRFKNFWGGFDGSGTILV